MSQTKIIVTELHPSINVWKNWHYMRYNKEKQRWMTMIWALTRGTSRIEGKVDVTVTYYFKTKARHDIDNYTPKMIMDGLVEAGIIQDDNSDVVVSLTVKLLYDKANPRTEIEIRQCP